VILLNFSVIARPAESLPLRQPDSDGRSIWNMMHAHYMGRICLIVDEDYQQDLLETWLKSEKFKPSVYQIIDEKRPDLKAEKIHRVGAIFGRPSWYVDNDPHVCAHTLALGIPTLLVACPYVLRPEWVQQKDMRKWDDLVEEMNSQALRAAERSWKDDE